MESMSTLIPRLWPFLSHSSSSVRKSTLVTLQTLTKSSNNIEINKYSSVIVTTGNVNPNETGGVIVSGNPSNHSEINFDSKNLKLNFGVKDWLSNLLQEALRHIYQRILVEQQHEIQQLAQQVWTNMICNANLTALLHAACPYVSSWICLAMQPPRLAFDSSILIQTISTTDLSQRRRTHRIGDDLGGNVILQQKLYLGGPESTPQDVRERNYLRARVIASRVLGSLSHYLVQPAPGVDYTATTESPISCYTKVLHGHLQSRSAVQRTVCGKILHLIFFPFAAFPMPTYFINR